jgi:hypothetical protein
MHSHQRMTQFIRNRTDINSMQGGRDASQKITEQQAQDAGMINFLRGGKMFGGETIINRIRMFTYRIGGGSVFGTVVGIILLILLLLIGYMRVTTGNFDFITEFKFPGQTVKPVQKFEFF